MTTATRPPGLTDRAVAMLRAVAAGRAHITVSVEPDLYVDGLPCCDQSTAHELAHTGLVAPAHPAPPRTRVRAELTAAGWEVLAGR
ncbi:hypothetical protein [Amycolatopsis sp.]|uniref:hypothetical protein n=1 Tax=Amycolatopsis sp. TaxID=37632 RepID=UPI002D7F8269|nr:hypothetical protein [Amycolatopsis sp.]HET6705674.1 hypothetical protein [Amycolatopsis sp.]